MSFIFHKNLESLSLNTTEKCEIPTDQSLIAIVHPGYIPQRITD